ncbi:unnamed protein product, partial [Ectocarpus fasciculatus]
MLKLSANNYLQWKFTALPLIEHYDFMPFYNGTEVEPPDPNEAGIRDAEKQRRTPIHAQWCNRRKSAALFLSFACGKDDELLQAMVGVDPNDPKAIWDRIQYLFNSTSVANSLNMERALNDFIYESGGTLTPRQYIHQFRELFQRAVDTGNPIS